MKIRIFFLSFDRNRYICGMFDSQIQIQRMKEKICTFHVFKAKFVSASLGIFQKLHNQIFEKTTFYVSIYENIMFFLNAYFADLKRV